MDPLSYGTVCDTLTMHHSSGCYHHPHQEFFDHGKITLICKHCELICWYGFHQSFHRLQIQPDRLCIRKMSCSKKIWNHFPHTVEVKLPVPCSFSMNEMLHQGHLLDILHPEFPSSALTHSLGNELLNNQGELLDTHLIGYVSGVLFPILVIMLIFVISVSHHDIACVKAYV